jgi:hypothetical protein
VRLLRNFRDSFSFGLGWAPSLFLLVVVMLLHLALVLMKIGFVNSRRSDLKRFDVARPTLHYFSFLVLTGLNLCPCSVPAQRSSDGALEIMYFLRRD